MGHSKLTTRLHHVNRHPGERSERRHYCFAAAGLLPPGRILPALLVGLALRIFLVLRFPVDTPDAQLYEELARNWLTLHVYGLTGATGVVPTDIRAPGYPAFLAMMCLFVGCGRLAVLLAQAILDLGTCFLAAWLAAALVSGAQRHRVAAGRRCGSR